MPRIEVRSTSTGETHLCTSSNPETISAWLIEMMHLLAPSDVAPMQVRCWALALPVDGKLTPDWPEFNGYPVRLVSAQGSAGLRMLAEQLNHSADAMDAPSGEELEAYSQESAV